ncbi:MAG: efflux RND transporter periplasmic adaptor subunit [Planctomycetota bacterium]|nr:MAG: efflux RND transporter periplasmic adaptor subunit [Planctomycetota bacterium]
MRSLPSARLPLLLVAALTPMPTACTRPAGPPPADDPDGAPAAGEAAESDQEPVLVRTAPVTRRTIERALEATADVVSLDVVDVYPERNQPVVELLVEEGDRVEAGQVLARLRDDLERLAVAEARVRLAEAEDELQRAETDHQRNVALLAGDVPGGTGAISERELETSKMALVTARTAVEASRVALDRAEFELAQTVIRAPIAGTIAVREISLGDMANPAVRAFQIVDESHPKAVFHRPQRELSLLRVGQPLVATCEALPGVEIRGRVERIAPTVDSASGTVKVTAALDAETPVPIGVLIRLRLILDRHEDALLVPKKALIYQGDEVFCFVVRDDRAVRLPLRCGFEEPDWMEILPDPERPLRPDDRVVVVGGDRLADGDPVAPAEEA